MRREHMGNPQKFRQPSTPKRFRDLTADGSGLVALSYRGYGGSSGQPTEKGLVEDAKAAYAFSVAHYPAERLVLWGESPV